MNGTRAKELRRAAKLLSDGVWRDYVAVRQRNAYGRPVGATVTDDGLVLRTGFGIELTQESGRRKYRRMKHYYKQGRRYPRLYAKRYSYLEATP